MATRKFKIRRLPGQRCGPCGPPAAPCTARRTPAGRSPVPAPGDHVSKCGRSSAHSPVSADPCALPWRTKSSTPLHAAGPPVSGRSVHPERLADRGPNLPQKSAPGPRLPRERHQHRPDAAGTARLHSRQTPNDLQGRMTRGGRRRFPW